MLTRFEDAFVSWLLSRGDAASNEDMQWNVEGRILTQKLAKLSVPLKRYSKHSCLRCAVSLKEKHVTSNKYKTILQHRTKKLGGF